MDVNKVTVKLGRDYYNGYYWIEPAKNGNNDIYISYEGIRKKQKVKKSEPDTAVKKLAEQMLTVLLNDL